jgi:hypothetical protein
MGWNDTIFGNATTYHDLEPVVYHMDGSSGILDNAREIKMRIKALAYAYRMTNDSKWVDRTWLEVAVSLAAVPFSVRLNVCVIECCWQRLYNFWPGRR